MPAPTTAKTYDQVLAQTVQVKNETVEGANSANRIGTVLKDILDFAAVNGGGGGNTGTAPTVETLTTVVANGNIALDTRILIKFTSTPSSLPIRLDDSGEAVLAKNNAKNILSLTKQKTGEASPTSITVTDAMIVSYDSAQASKLLTIDLNPTGFNDEDTTYTLNVAGYKTGTNATNNSASGASATFVFKTNKQLIRFPTSAFDATTGLLKVATGSANSRNFTGNVWDATFANSINAFCAITYEGFLHVFDKNDFSIDNGATGFDLGQTNGIVVGWDDTNKFLFIQISSTANIRCIRITRVGNTFTLTNIGTVLTESRLQSVRGSFKAISAINNKQYLSALCPNNNSSGMDLMFYEINPTTGILTNLGKDKVGFAPVTDLLGYLGTDVDTKANQLVFGNNFKRFDLAIGVDNHPTFNNVSGYSNSLLNVWKVNYNEQNQIILIGVTGLSSSDSVLGIKANIATNTFIQFSNKDNNLVGQIDVENAYVLIPFLIDNTFYLSRGSNFSKYPVTFS